MKKIAKINQLKNVESFMQVNLYKGFKYIDKAGEIVNLFYKNDSPPNFQMNLNGLIIEDPEDNVKELKVTPTNLWMHYLIPNSLDQVSSQFKSNLDKINKILEPAGNLRIGWRNYFIYEMSEVIKSKVSSKLLRGKSGDFVQLVFSIELNNINNNFTIQFAKKKDSDIQALLFDIDSFIEYEKSVDMDRVIKDIDRIQNLLNSKVFLEKINEILLD